MGDPAGIGPETIAKAFRDAPEATARLLRGRRRGHAAARGAHRAGRGRGGVPVAAIGVGRPRRWRRRRAACRCCRWRRRAVAVPDGPDQRARPAAPGRRLRDMGGARGAAWRGGGLVTAPLAQGGAGGRRRALRPLSRATPSCCRPRRPRARAFRWTGAGAHDAGQRRAARGAGQHPPLAARGHRQGNLANVRETLRITHGRGAALGRPRASPWPG
jgi:hypothetical protein